jgi:23S rRNA pseudouridine1911/1915/1917 synthase
MLMSILTMKNSNDPSGEFEIVYDDPFIAIIDKPAGIPVQSIEKDNDLETKLAQRMGFQVYPITRIDQSVSGLVLFAKNKKSAAKWSEMIRNNQIIKTYLAIVEGKLKEGDEVILKHKLLKVKNKSTLDKQGEDAELSFVVIKVFDNYTLLKINTQTGRFHQIRCQLQAYGHSIKGDIKYGSKRTNKIPGIMLHCHQLTFLHPFNKEKIDIISPYPDNENWRIFS